MTDQIKNCPFCGSEAAATQGILNKVTMIICKNYKSCGATVSFDCSAANSQGEAASIQRWNRRANSADKKIKLK